MPRARITDTLSSAAQHLMAASFRSKLPAAMIAAKIKAETGEVVAERTIGRRKSEWDAEQLRKQANVETMENLVAAMKASNFDADEMVKALTLKGLQAESISLDPLELQKVSLQADKVQLQRDTLELKKRQIALDEAKFDLMKQREKQAIEATDALERKAASGQSITPDDIRKIRQEVYGLNT